MSRRRESRVMLGSAAVACSTWLRVSTSSPTRFIMRFSSVTSTRSVLSAAVPAAWRARLWRRRCRLGAAGVAQRRRAASAAAALQAVGRRRRRSARRQRAALCSELGPRCGSPHGRAGASAPGVAWLRLLPEPATSSRRAISAVSSPSPSLASASIVFRIARRPSSSCSSAVITGASAASLPSRNRPSRFSPEWASFSRRLKPRKPVVPLMVCTERKISPAARHPAAAPPARSGTAPCGPGLPGSRSGTPSSDHPLPTLVRPAEVALTHGTAQRFYRKDGAQLEKRRE